MFGIEFDKTQLVAIGLNAIGYLAAGGLSVLIYSAVTKRRWRRIFAEIIEQGAAIVASSQGAEPTVRTDANANQVTFDGDDAMKVNNVRVGACHQNPSSDRIDEFVSFEHMSHSGHSHRTLAGVDSDDRAIRERVSGAVTRYRSAIGGDGELRATGSYTRNRADVIRLAKEMLASGQSSESVRRELPINESEMRLVELGSRG